MYGVADMSAVLIRRALHGGLVGRQRTELQKRKISDGFESLMLMLENNWIR